ncbi:hypothetical protein [Streptomyces sp. NPDC020330]|uniref:hypothetical protein n=1 Tax=unclassified Streptomyces TaxID=2593676 RepID=UPI0037AE954C
MNSPHVPAPVRPLYRRHRLRSAALAATFAALLLGAAGKAPATPAPAGAPTGAECPVAPAVKAQCPTGQGGDGAH